LSGTVVDQTGALVADADVKVSHQFIRVPRHTKTNEMGSFEFTYLLPGLYSLRVSALGFVTAEKRDVKVVDGNWSSVGKVELRMGRVSRELTFTVTPSSRLDVERGIVVPLPAQVTWKDENGKLKTAAELERLIDSHERWLDSEGRSGAVGDFSRTDLSGAQFRNRKLKQAWFRSTNLTGADFSGADLDSADLGSANLAHAHLEGTNLSNADLTNTEVAGARFDEADLDGVTFEARGNPDVRGIASAENLDMMQYDQNPDALVQLRKQFQDGGFRDQERKITCAINRSRARLDHWAVGWARWVLFDETCEYGLSPFRPLVLAFWLWCVCSVLYFVCTHTRGRAALFRVRKIEANPSASQVVERLEPPHITSHRWLGRAGQLMWGELRDLAWAAFFSLMCAFNIGFRDINFGRWLRLLAPREVDVTAEGWARSVAGLQSLTTVYLIALFVLTYFGRPFE
jgi:hypothetical protein